MEEWREHELIGAKCHDKADAAGAAEAYMKAAMTDKYLRSQRMHYSNYLFALHYLSGINNDELAQEHFVYNKLYAEVEHLQLKRNIGKITIGYIATSFTESSTSRFTEALLLKHSDEYKVKVFSLTSERDEWTERIKATVDEYVELIDLSIEESAQKIALSEIDILFDLSGHSDGGMTLQILGYKPARIQVVGIGWFDTTGMKAIDYILTDNYLTPIGHEKYFSEKLLRMRGAFAFTPTVEMRAIQIKRQANNRIVFGSYNNFMKVTDDYLRVVKRILKQVPESRFILQDTTDILERKTEMERRLINLKIPTEYVQVRLGRADYLKSYGEIDIMLDTYPYSGGMMTATAMYMGVPVISMYGNRYSTRFGADMLRLVGVTELIATSESEYIKLAVELANDDKRLKELHETLRKRLEQSHLMDTTRYVAELESLYRRLIIQ